MNTFFYGGQSGEQEQQFAEKLFARTYFSKMSVLPGGCELNSPLSLQLRCGDLMILCAATDASFDALLSIYEKFEDFRIIVVLPRLDDDLVKKSHLFRPRYITCMASDLDELDTVVEKMRSSENDIIHKKIYHDS